MKNFTMCAECDREYHDPSDRRFHAQPNACARCGPSLELWDATGKVIAGEAITNAIDAMHAGKILALKGLGGFQVVVDATNENAVARLRERKHREEKPLAVMVSSLAAAKNLCEITTMEERLLLSPESPIVLLERKENAQVAASVAPNNPNLGVMLPYTPLHHLLLHWLDVAVVATSGNLSDEPICIDEHEALKRLKGIADVFLVHNRPIARHMDDSIARIMARRELVLRRSRGYAPLPVQLPQATRSILALGAHLKNTIALGVGRNVFLSQHIGDLETPEAYEAFVKSAADLPRLYETIPETIACDQHPDYLSTKHAAQFSAPTHPVQHHFAHIASCMAENELAPPLLGVAWDGTGYGGDGTIWGGEFLDVNTRGFTRFAHLRQFRLAGGEAAVKEPRRCVLGLLAEIFGEELWQKAELLKGFEANELALLRQVLKKQINAPLTSSAGRLFDAVAGLIGLRTRASFEGQAAMELEFAILPNIELSYRYEFRGDSPIVIDWQPAVIEIVNDLGAGESIGVISAKFHNMLVEVILAIAREANQTKIVLSGGCFQNRYLSERAIDRLSKEGFRPYWHQRIPPNDGGISLGQIFATSMQS